MMRIDTSFDVRTDAGGKDPDAHSPTLRKYHQLLWSKPLPCGRSFHLSATVPRAYLHHQSELGDFTLTSDSVIPTFTRWKSMSHIIGQLPEYENEAFRTICYTIGGMTIFPGNIVDGKQTINGARGFNRKIADRFDLTLECIRRFYMSKDNPLSETLNRYRSFFELFSNFRGYVEFFLLEDLVATDGNAVNFFMPFDEFTTSSVPNSLESYMNYRSRTVEFVEARNRRIELSRSMGS